MRGPAPSIECPRCGQTAPPQDGVASFVTCLGCGLSFEATYRERVQPPRPRACEGLELSTQLVAGAFRSSAMAVARKAFPIAGDGTIELTGDHLVVTGYQTRAGHVRFIVGLVALAACIIVATGLVTLGLSDRIAIAVGMAVFVAGVLAPIPASKHRTRFEIPMDCLGELTLVSKRLPLLPPPGTVVLVVRDFEPSGEIQFRPADPLALEAAIKRRPR